MLEPSNIQLIQELYAAFGRGDVARVLEMLAPEAELDFEAAATIPWAGSWHGREGWAGFFGALGTNLEDIAMQMELFAAQGDNVAFIGRYQARVRRTGRRIDSPLVHLWTIRDGRVVKCRELTNTAAETAACSD